MTGWPQPKMDDIHSTIHECPNHCAIIEPLDFFETNFFPKVFVSFPKFLQLQQIGLTTENCSYSPAM